MTEVAGFFQRLAGHGDHIALADGTRNWTYRELLDASRLWRQRLDELGSRRVAFRLDNGADWIALDLALLHSGRIAIPLPDFFSAAQEQHVLRVSGADTFVTAAACTAGFRTVDRAERAWLLRREVTAAPEVHRGTAKITFTSGTTGTPKGVCLSAAHLLATAAAIQQALGGAGIRQHLSALPLSLLLENVAGVYASLGNGSRIGVPPLAAMGLTGSSGLDVQAFVDAQHAYRPQSLILVPQLLLALTAAAEFGLALPDSYRFIAVGGGKVAPSLLQRAQRLGLPVFEGYGLTECGSVVAVNLPGADRPGTVGRPLAHVTVGIVDGEIQVLGNAMLGYLGEPPAPARVATGDLGTVDADGYVRVAGRRRSGFITAFGRNVNPEWPESELTAELAIGHAVVFGEALPANVALLVPRANADAASMAAAVAAANARLPDYARIGPWRLIDADTFAAAGCLTDNGRLRRNVAAARFAGALQSLHHELEESHAAAVRAARIPHH